MYASCLMRKYFAKILFVANVVTICWLLLIQRSQYRLICCKLFSCSFTKVCEFVSRQNTIVFCIGYPIHGSPKLLSNNPSIFIQTTGRKIRFSSVVFYIVVVLKSIVYTIVIVTCFKINLASDG